MAIKTPVVASENIKDKAFTTRGNSATVLCVDPSNGDMYLAGQFSRFNPYVFPNQCIVSQTDAAFVWPPMIDSFNLNVPGQCYYAISDGSGGVYSCGTNYATRIGFDKQEISWLDHRPQGDVRGIYIEGTTTYMWGNITSMIKKTDGIGTSINPHLFRFVNRRIRFILEPNCKWNC